MSCDTSRLAAIVVYLIFNFISILAVIIITWDYIRKKHFKSGGAKLKCIAIIFLTQTLTALILKFLHNLLACIDPTISESLIPPFVLFRLSQLITLIYIWFYRISIAFSGSIFELSTTSTRTFNICFIMFILYLLATFAGIMGTSSVERNVNGIYLIVIFAIASFGLYLLFVVSLLILFVYKLVQVYRNVDNNERYLFIITKITLLNWTSFVTTIIFMIFLVISRSNDHLYQLEIVSEFIDIMDNFSNFVFIILSFHAYDNHYLKTCKYCHNICYLGCSKLFGINSKTMDDIILDKTMSEITKESREGTEASV